MIQFDLIGAREALSFTQDVEKQLKYLTKTSLNDLAYSAVVGHKKEMRDVFDRPTPGTLNSVLVKQATPSNLTAELYIKDYQAKGNAPSYWLDKEIHGGRRRTKRWESLLINTGIMPDHQLAVPGYGVKLDAYGNVSAGLIIQLLAYFKAFPEMGYKANWTQLQRDKLKKGTKKRYGVYYFVGRPNRDNTWGIWKVTRSGFGSALQSMFIFVDKADYEPTYDFDYTTQWWVDKYAQNIFQANLRKVISTAR